MRTIARPALTGKGRIGRSDFIKFTVGAFLFILSARYFSEENVLRAIMSMFGVWIFGCATAARLHDFNRSILMLWPILLVFPIGALSPVLWSALGSVFTDLYADTYEFFYIAAISM